MQLTFSHYPQWSLRPKLIMNAPLYAPLRFSGIPAPREAPRQNRTLSLTLRSMLNFVCPRWSRLSTWWPTIGINNNKSNSIPLFLSSIVFFSIASQCHNATIHKTTQPHTIPPSSTTSWTMLVQHLRCVIMLVYLIAQTMNALSVNCRFMLIANLHADPIS